MAKKQPILSISMLVSNNRRDTIEKCMESLVPLMKAVPSELIIVDTGCTDGSVDIARKYADKVVQFTWCKDFSAARNAGLCECTGEWFLYLDDDEWFEDVSELIVFFLGEERYRYDTLWYIQRNYGDFEGVSYSDCYVGRCVKRRPETVFCGKIHEWLEPLPRYIKQVETFVHHYGYVYKTEEDSRKHLERNLTLEEAAVKENPDDIRMCCQLVQEYRAADRFEDAVRVARETLQRTRYEKTDSFVQHMMITIPKVYMEAGKEDKSLEEYDRLLKEEVLLHQSKLAIYCEKAFLYGRGNKRKEAIEESLNYLKEYAVVPRKDEPAEFAVMDFMQYRSRLTRQKVIRTGITGAALNNEYEYLEGLFAELDWEQDVELSKEMVKALMQCYLRSNDANLLIRELRRILQVESLLVPVYAILHSAYVEFPDKHLELAEVLERINRRDGNFAFFHLIYTEEKGITTEQDVSDYYEKSDRKYDAEVAELLFTGAMKKMVEVSEAKKIGKIEAALWECIRWAKAYTEATEGENAWESGNLPEELLELWFARYMEMALCTEDAAEYSGLLKEAAAKCPVYVPVIKALLEERELLSLTKQLKDTVQGLLDGGKTEEAAAILTELATMLPEDEEVKVLLREI